MTTKLKKQGINITIENNLFSKNKTTDKKEEQQVEENTSFPNYQQVNDPFEPEPAFLGEIRNHMAERQFYNMRINPLRPSYTDMNDVHSRFLNNLESNIPEPVKDKYSLSEPSEYDNNTTLPREEPQNTDTADKNDDTLFDIDGTYKGNPKNRTLNTKKRKDYLAYKIKPQKSSLKKYGLPEDFLDDWEEKRQNNG